MYTSVRSPRASSKCFGRSEVLADKQNHEVTPYSLYGFCTHHACLPSRTLCSRALQRAVLHRVWAPLCSSEPTSCSNMYLTLNIRQHIVHECIAWGGPECSMKDMAATCQHCSLKENSSTGLTWHIHTHLYKRGIPSTVLF